MPRRGLLTIDVDPEMRLPVQTRLQANNYDAHKTVSPVSAIAEIRRALPDGMLLDPGMPASDGYPVFGTAV